MKKSKVLAAIALLMCLALTCVFAQGQGETTGTDGEKMTTIKVAYHPHITGVGGILNAIDNGYFAEENLNVELVQFTSGATELAAMASGDIDIGYLGVGAHVFAPKGQCVILALDSTDLSGEVLTRGDSGIKTMQDLKGKNVSIGASGSGVYFNAIDLLNAYGLTEEDINPTYESFADSADSLKDGKIDAAFITAGAPTTAVTDLGTAKDVYLVSIDDEHMKTLLEECPY